MEHLRSSLLSHIHAADASALADPAIKALSVNEVLSFSHAIDHQLLSMKRGVLGSDIEEFVMHLLSTNLGGGAFPRSPTVKELQLCRKLARVEDDDIVTQLQILRMLDAFRQLTVIFQRALLGVMCDGMEEASEGQPKQQEQRSPYSAQGTGKQQKISAALAERIELNEDVSASASALTEGTMFSGIADGMIPTYVLYQLVERYGLDARLWLRHHSAITLLPSGDDAVVALREMMEKEKLRIKSTSGTMQPSGGSPQGGEDEAHDDHHVASSLPPSPPGGASSSPPGSRKISIGGASSPSKVVPIEFISTSILTDTFLPLDDKVLRAFVGAFGAFDPNDPQNELGLSNSLVDGHLMLILPIVQFAQVLSIAVPKAIKVLQGALEGVVHPSSALNAGGGAAGGSAASAARRRASRAAGGSVGVHDHVLATSAGNQMFDEIDDVFSTGGFSSNLPAVGRKASFQYRDVPGTVSLPPARAAGAKVLPINADGSGGTTPNEGGSAALSSTAAQAQPQDAGAFETLPQSFANVIARGYLRFPEFELVIRYLNGKKAHSLERKKEAQQQLVDEIALASAAANSTATPAAAAALPPSRKHHQAFQRKAPTSEEEQALIDEQATFFESIIFHQSSSLSTLGHQQDVKESSLRKQQVKIDAPHSGQASCVSPPPGALQEIPASLNEPQHGGSSSHSPVTTTAGDGGGGLGNASTTQSKQRRTGKGAAGTAKGRAGGSDASPPLHGWPIHVHHAQRLDTEPYNGKDVERLRRSVMASPERSIQSYVNTKQLPMDDNSASHGAASKVMPSSARIAASNAAVVSLLDGGAGAAAGNATAAASLTPGGAAVKKAAPISPRQRQLMAVLNMGVMHDILNAIPEDPLHLLNVDLRPKPGGGFSSVMVAASNPSNAGSAVAPAVGGGCPGGAMPSLSLAALMQVHDAGGGSSGLMGNPPNSSTTAGGGDVEGLENSFSTRGGRSATKHQASSSSYGRQSIAPAKSLTDPTHLDDTAARSSLFLRNASTSQFRSRACDDITSPSTASAGGGGDKSYAADAGNGVAVDGAAGLGNICNSNNTGPATTRCGGDGISLDDKHHHHHNRLASSNNDHPQRAVKRPDHGIHATAWRSVHYIPKLPAEALGDYCNLAKRSGGGFGARGRQPLPRLDPTTTEDAMAQSVHTDSVIAVHAPPPVEQTAGSVPEEEPTQGGHEQAGDDRETGADNPPCHVTEGQDGISVGNSKNTNRLPGNHPPKHKQKPSPRRRSPQEEEQQQSLRPTEATVPTGRGNTDDGGNNKPKRLKRCEDGDTSPRLARPTASSKASSQPPKPRHHHRPAPQPDPSVELRPPPQPMRPQPPQGGAATARTAVTNVAPAMPAAPAPPLHRAVMGFMAVMDPSRHRVTGGSMLSFIPPALAADAIHSLNLRTTYPTTVGGGRGSLRGSLLEPISGGGPSASSRLRQHNDGAQQVADPMHTAVMAHNRQQMNKLRYA